MMQFMYAETWVAVTGHSYSQAAIVSVASFNARPDSYRVDRSEWAQALAEHHETKRMASLFAAYLTDHVETMHTR
jgi:hypothetical protein